MSPALGPKPRRVGLALSLTALLLGALACRGQGAAPQAQGAAPMVVPAAVPLDAAGTPHLSPADRCPVCGMTVAEHPKFASAIALKDGTTYHFCGTGCLIKSWLHPEIFLGHGKADLARAVTPEYFGGAYIDALEARWVAGSDVVGPMGPALVPLKNDADLDTFQTRHGGKAVFSLKDLDDARFEALTGKRAAMRPPHGS